LYKDYCIKWSVTSRLALFSVIVEYFNCAWLVRYRRCSTHSFWGDDGAKKLHGD